MRDRRDDVTGIIAGEDFEHGRGILDGAAHRAAAVARERQRDDASAADEPLRRHQADQRVER